MFILVLKYFYNFTIILLQLECSESTNYSVSHRFKILVISLKFILQRIFKPFWFNAVYLYVDAAILSSNYQS